MALPVLAAAAPAGSNDREIRRMLKHCADEREKLSCLERDV
jgi:hypothetical protein